MQVDNKQKKMNKNTKREKYVLALRKHWRVKLLTKANDNWWKKFNHYAVGGQFGQYKMMQKTENWPKPWHMGTYLRVLSESYLMNTNMAGFRWFSNISVSLCFGQKG